MALGWETFVTPGEGDTDRQGSRLLRTIPCQQPAVFRVRRVLEEPLGFPASPPGNLANNESYRSRRCLKRSPRDTCLKQKRVKEVGEDPIFLCVLQNNAEEETGIALVLVLVNPAF